MLAPPYQPSPAMQRMQVTGLTLLVASGTVNYLDRSALAIANPQIRAEMGLSATAMGVLLSAFLVSYAVCQLPIGLLVDRVGGRRLLGAGLVVWSLAQAASGFVGSFAQFWWARVALGLGESPQFPTGARVVSDWFNVRDRGLPTGIFNSASSVGPALAPPVLTALMLGFGWRATFVILGVLGLGVAAVWFALYRDPKGHATPDDLAFIGADAPAAPPITLSDWGRLFRFPIVWAMVAGNFCFGYLNWIYFAWLPGFLEIQHHVSIARTGIYAAIPPAFGIVGSVLGGWVSDRLASGGATPLKSRKIPLVTGILGTAACTFAAAYAENFALVMVLVTAAAFFSTVTSGTVWALATAAAPQSCVASVGAIQNFGGYLGGTCSPIITGLVVDRTGSFVLALVFGASVALVGAVVYAMGVTQPIGAEAFARKIEV